MSSQIVGDLAAAGGMANVNCALQVEMRRQRRQIIGIVIHVVTVAYLRGPAMTPAVMSYDAIAVLEKKQHLRVPVIGGQRPAMAEHDGLTFAPVLVKDLDAVFGRNRTHWELLCGKSASEADGHKFGKKRRIDGKLAPLCVGSGRPHCCNSSSSVRPAFLRAATVSRISTSAGFMIELDQGPMTALGHKRTVRRGLPSSSGAGELSS